MGAEAWSSGESWGLEIGMWVPSVYSGTHGSRRDCLDRWGKGEAESEASQCLELLAQDTLFFFFVTETYFKAQCGEMKGRLVTVV